MGVGRWGGSAEVVEILVLHAFSLDSLETENIVLRLGRMKSESPGLEMNHEGIDIANYRWDEYSSGGWCQVNHASRGDEGLA